MLFLAVVGEPDHRNPAAPSWVVEEASTFWIQSVLAHPLCV